MMLRITALIENKSHNPQLKSYPGLSLLLEDGEQKILFDTGADDRFLQNAAVLGINLTNIKTIVISHGHYDHFGGLTQIDKHFFDQPPSVISHPHIFYHRRAALFIGPFALKFKYLSPKFDKEKLSKQFNFVLSEDYQTISSRFIYAGAVTQRVVRKCYGVLIKEEGDEDDYVMDDSFLVWKGDKGLVIISGCSHSGIESIIQHAKSITQETRIQAIVGGLHLRCATPAALWRAKNAIDADTQVYGCHCTGALGRMVLHAADFNTGEVLSFE